MIEGASYDTYLISKSSNMILCGLQHDRYWSVMPNSKKTPRYAKNSTLAACIAVFALGQFQRASGSVFGPVLGEQFAVPATALGALVGVMFAATLVAQAPAGVLLDRWGPRRVLVWALVLMACGSALFALAPHLDNAAWPAMIAARTVLGFGLAATGAGVQMALAHGFPDNDYGYASGILVTFGGVGGLVGTWPLAAALECCPWAVVFGTVAVVACLIAVVVDVTLPRTTPTEAEPVASSSCFRALLRNKSFRGVLYLSSVTYAPIVTITGLWAGPYLRDAHGLEPAAAGKALMALFAATLAAGIAFGRLDRLGNGRSSIILAAAAGSGVCLFALALLPVASLATALVLLIGTVFLQQFYIPLGVQMRDAVQASAFGRAQAVMMIVAIGTIPIMQTAFGFILDASRGAGFDAITSYRFAFGAMALSIALALTGYWRTHGKHAMDEIGLSVK